jgi:hypothetical protein
MTVMTHVGRSLYRSARAFLCVFAIFLVAATLNLIGIWIVGDVRSWGRWLEEHSGHFAVWRSALYVATGLGWWWMRNRVLSREPKSETRTRLIRTEIAAVLAVVILEVTTFLQMR